MIKERILIVEDNRNAAIHLKEEIKKVADSATDVLLAGSYGEALPIAKRGDIAYCILDLGLPEQPEGDPIEIKGKDVCRLGF